MITKHLPDGTQIPAIGLGMWDYGGKLEADYNRDEAEIPALRRAIEMGYRHFDTAEVYAAGHSEELLGRTLQDYDRDDFFITTKVSPEHLGYDDVLAACARSLNRLQISTIDLYLIHWPSKHLPLTESFRALNQLVDEGKVKRIGVSNFDVPLLEEAVKLCETPLASNQVKYNLLSRGPVENGVLKYCQENSILLTAYSPVKNGVLENRTVQEIARTLTATPAQVALAWLIRQQNVITIPKSSNGQRQKENLEATKIELTEVDLERLDNLIQG